MAESSTYKEVSERAGCCINTVCRKVRNVHHHCDSDDEFRQNLNAIFDEAERDEQLLTCKLIRNRLAVNFNFSISLYKLYIELKKHASYRVPTAVLFLTDLNKASRIAHANLILIFTF